MAVQPQLAKTFKYVFNIHGNTGLILLIVMGLTTYALRGDVDSLN